MINLYPLARHALFALDAEAAHDFTLTNLERAYSIGATKLAFHAVPKVPRTVMGLQFSNPVGLAAGLDKNGAHIDAFGAMGFGFIEVGTVTPKAQPGNPKPRMFRLPQANALINRMGFNNLGLDQFLLNVQRSRYRERGGILGLNIGKNAATPVQNATDDYLIGLNGVYPHADYITVNISSPNTKNLRQLQGADELDALLKALNEQRKRLQDQHARAVPLLLKIAPDLDADQIKEIADRLLKHRIDGCIATNTTIARDAVAGLEHAQETGGLSGAPVRAASTQVIAQMRQHVGRELAIIGVGGILNGADAVEKIQAGADLVQLYTGLIYTGPVLIKQCAKAIKQMA